MVYKPVSSIEPLTRPIATLTKAAIGTAFNAALDTILPPICLICEQSALSASRLCRDCQPHIAHNPHKAKLRCLCCSVVIAPPSLGSRPKENKPIKNNKLSVDSALYCAQCIKQPPLFDRCISALDYSPMPAKLINQLKHQGKLAATIPISHSIARAVQGHYQDLASRIDLAVAVPLHTDRLKQRGFNQAHEIAKPVCQQLSIPLAVNLCQRRFDNPPQQLANRAARHNNLHGAFIVNNHLTRKTQQVNTQSAASSIAQPKHLSVSNIKQALQRLPIPTSKTLIASKQIAIIDDVVTTGATANALAKSLLDAGASRCDIWCFARTPRK